VGHVIKLWKCFDEKFSVHELAASRINYAVRVKSCPYRRQNTLDH
jgi:hypothetical protein